MAAAGAGPVFWAAVRASVAPSEGGVGSAELTAAGAWLGELTGPAVPKVADGGVRAGPHAVAARVQHTAPTIRLTRGLPDHGRIDTARIPSTTSAYVVIQAAMTVFHVPDRAPEKVLVVAGE
jgi:hypothetical protein